MLDASKNEVPAGFVLLQRHDGKPLYAACLDGGRFHGWLMSKHPDGQWVSQRKLESWEVMQSEDQRDYGIVHETAATKPTACALPPTGWTCTRAPGHEGPCAAVATEVCADDYTPEQMVIYQHGVEDGKLVARGMERYKAGIAAREAATKPAAAPAVPEGFAEWLSREMPAGTVINDPAWWAPRIVRALAATPSPQIAEVAELPPRREPHSTDTRDQAHLAEGWNACLDAIAASRRAAGGEVLHEAAQAINRLLGAVEGLSYVDSAREFGERTLANILRITEAAPASAGQAAPALPAIKSVSRFTDTQQRGVLVICNGRVSDDELEAIRARLAAQPAEGAGQAERHIKYLESLVYAYGPKSLQYDIEHPNDGLNSADPNEVSRTSRSLPKSGGAGQAGQVAKLADAVNTMLWLYRRLPGAYGKPPFVDAALIDLAAIAGVDGVPEAIKERATLLDATQQPSAQVKP